MWCKKCETTKVLTDGSIQKIRGRVFVDRIFSERSHVELFCINCGARWMLDKGKSVFAAWLMKVEESHAAAVTLT